MANSRRTQTQKPSAAQAQRRALIQTVSAQQEALEQMQTQLTVSSRVAHQTRASLVEVLKLTGVEKHPRFARLVQAADEDNNPVATSNEQALNSITKDNPESVGTSPAEVNKGVTPAATTDVQNADVALSGEPFNKLIDPTSVAPGVDTVPTGDAAHVKTDVRVGEPSKDVAFADTGWKNTSASRTAGDVPEAFKDQWDKNKDDDDDDDSDKDSDKSKTSVRGEERAMAAFALAKARREAGMTAESSEIIEAQQITASDMSVGDMDKELVIMAKVAARLGSATQDRPVPRNLVPTRQATRSAPSLASGSAPIPGSGSGLEDSSNFD